MFSFVSFVDNLALEGEGVEDVEGSPPVQHGDGPDVEQGEGEVEPVQHRRPLPHAYNNSSYKLRKAKKIGIGGQIKSDRREEVTVFNKKLENKFSKINIFFCVTCYFK